MCTKNLMHLNFVLLFAIICKKNFEGHSMNIQIKQRAVGIVILILVILSVTAILLFGSKRSRADDSRIDVQIPVEATQQIANSSLPPPAVNSSQPEVLNNNPGSSSSTDQIIPQENTTQTNISPKPNDVPTSQPQPTTTNNDNLVSAPSDPKVNTDAANLNQAPDIVKSETPSTMTSDVNQAKSSNTLKSMPTAKQKPKVIENDTLAAAQKPAVPIKEVVLEHAEKHKTKTVGVKHATTKNLSSSKGKWAVKVGSFADQVKAQDLIKKLSKNGYRIFVQKKARENNPNIIEMLVFVGPELTKNKAQNTALKLNDSFHLNAQIAKHK
jgi:cell division septation protein DedD